MSLYAVRTPLHPVRTEPVLRQAQDDRKCEFERVDYSEACAEGFDKHSPNGGS